LGIASPGVVDEYPAHHVGGHAKEVRAIVPVNATLIDQPEEGLVNKSRRLERVTGSLAPKLTRGDPAQFIVDNRQQLIEGVRVASTPITEGCRVVSCRHDVSSRSAKNSGSFRFDRKFPVVDPFRLRFTRSPSRPAGRGPFEQGDPT
jgi:hypothetical protein